MLGCILASEPTVPETKDVLTKCSHQLPADEGNNCEGGEGAVKRKLGMEDFDYVDFSSSDEEEHPVPQKNHSMPWLIEKCLCNLGSFTTDETKVRFCYLKNSKA